jgi:hypothetical protein
VCVWGLGISVQEGVCDMVIKSAPNRWEGSYLPPHWMYEGPSHQFSRTNESSFSWLIVI